MATTGTATEDAEGTHGFLGSCSSAARSGGATRRGGAGGKRGAAGGRRLTAPEGSGGGARFGRLSGPGSVLATRFFFCLFVLVFFFLPLRAAERAEICRPFSFSFGSRRSPPVTADADGRAREAPPHLLSEGRAQPAASRPGTGWAPRAGRGGQPRSLWPGGRAAQAARAASRAEGGGAVPE